MLKETCKIVLRSWFIKSSPGKVLLLCCTQEWGGFIGVQGEIFHERVTFFPNIDSRTSWKFTQLTRNFYVGHGKHQRQHHIGGLTSGDQGHNSVANVHRSYCSRSAPRCTPKIEHVQVVLCPLEQDSLYIFWKNGLRWCITFIRGWAHAKFARVLWRCCKYWQGR